MSNHTRDPWQARGRYILAGGVKIASAIPHETGPQRLGGAPGFGETVSNANLIAAAPDLLSALIRALPFLPQSRYDIAQAAIDKATGSE